MDTVSKEKRSEMMSRVKNRDSKMEVSFRKRALETRFSLQKKFGEIFRQAGHSFAKIRNGNIFGLLFLARLQRALPLTNYQNRVLERKNREEHRARQGKVNSHYEKIGWQIIRLWEHDLKKKDFKFDFDMLK